MFFVFSVVSKKVVFNAVLGYNLIPPQWSTCMNDLEKRLLKDVQDPAGEDPAHNDPGTAVTGMVPYSQPLEGLYLLAPLSMNIAVIEHRTNCLLVGAGDEGTFIADPSCKDSSEYVKLMNTLKKLQLPYSGIFITHHHIDHHLRSPQLARELSLPVFISQDSHRRLTSAKPGYFTGLEVKFAHEGDTLTRWNGKPVKVFEVPGHDRGQLALAPDSMEWFLVGDLIQNTGTVVIGGDEGDMISYFRTLERIIQLNPALIIPSHGKVLESVKQLEKTLRHRKKREQQVLHYHNEGKSPEEMVKLVYRRLDRRLWALAYENIKSHLKKLEKENTIKSDDNLRQ